MAHSAEVIEEQYVLKPETKKKLYILLVVGVAVFALGLFMAMSGGGHEEHGAGHASLSSHELVASADQHEAASAGHEKHEGAAHHETVTWVKRLYSTLWMNNVFFTGLGIIGLFFVAIQYAAQAGWSVGVKRVGIAMGTWIPVAGALMLGLWFLTSHDIFHWTHGSLYVEGGEGFDKIINKKAPFFFWPLAGGTFPV